VANSKGKASPGAKVTFAGEYWPGILLDTVANAMGQFSFTDMVLGKDVKYNVVATDAKGKKDVSVRGR